VVQVLDRAIMTAVKYLNIIKTNIYVVFIL
jgi:hypothetical protein